MTLGHYSLAALLLITACGEDKEQATDATSDPTAASTTDATDTGAPTTTTTGPTGAPAECSVSTVPIGPEITLTLRNAGTAPIFFQPDDGCGNRPFAITAPDDTALHTDALACHTCPGMKSACGCSDGCGSADVVQLDPGGRFDLVWTGNHFVEVEIPAACVDEFCGSTGCLEEQQVEPGLLGVEAFAADALIECGDCSCEANADGWCELTGTLGGQMRVAAATLEFPGATAVELVFP